jgi:hypothetical protein
MLQGFNRFSLEGDGVGDVGNSSEEELGVLGVTEQKTGISFF